MDTYPSVEQAMPQQGQYQAYDKIWQRVAPDLNPYPEVRAGREQEGGASGGEESGELITLPGAQADPCCMGTLAQDSVNVVLGFMEEAASDAWDYAALVRWTRDSGTARALRSLAAREQEHLRQLQAAYYLITGQCAQGQIQQGARRRPENFCAALRQAYHRAACAGFNYMRAADEAEDMCLQKLFQTMGEEEMDTAGALMALLSRMMG